jgi:hypothetical protein
MERAAQPSVDGDVTSLQAPRKEVVGKVGHVVKRVVVRDNRLLRVGQGPVVNLQRPTSLKKQNADKSSFGKSKRLLARRGRSESEDAAGNGLRLTEWKDAPTLMHK